MANKSTQQAVSLSLEAPAVDSAAIQTGFVPAPGAEAGQAQVTRLKRKKPAEPLDRDRKAQEGDVPLADSGLMSQEHVLMAQAEPSTEVIQVVEPAAISSPVAAPVAATSAVAAGGFGTLGLLGALGVGGLAIAAGSGGGGGGGAVSPQASGRVVDGYLAGATVFIDQDGDGQLDPGEASSTTDAQGNFRLPANQSGSIVAFGGTDISTGLPFVGVLRAPAGSTVVTPLTTLVSELMSSGSTTAAQAQETVLKALGLGGLNNKLDLRNYDPLAQTAGNADALALQKAAVTVATLVSNLTAKLQEVTAAPEAKQDDIARDVFSELSKLLAENALAGNGLSGTAGALVDALKARSSVGGETLDATESGALGKAKTFLVEGISDFSSDLNAVTDLGKIGERQKEALSNKTYTLQLLHFSDAEAGMLASGTAPYLAAMIDKFEDQYANSITLAGGDNFLPGPFLAAGTDASIRAIFNQLSGSTLTGTMPVAAVDIALHNLMGVEASAIGNHEFDLGSNTLAAAFKSTATYTGAQFPYVSANLDFSGDADLRSSFVDTTATAGLELASAYRGKIVPSAVLEEGGAKIGLVGATTQILENISSPSGTKVKDNDSITSDDLDLLAAQLQPVINDLIAQGVNKIILMAHLQILGNELALAGKLSGVDVILAAGSNTRLGDADDQAVAFPGHSASFADTYPVLRTDKDGNPTLIVNTDNEFTYLGRLVVDFDETGKILTESLTANKATNGAYASTSENAAAAWGVAVDQLATTALADGTRGGSVKALADAVQQVIVAKDGNVYGYTDVYLEGERAQVRSQETNLGSLSADANGYVAEQALGSAAANTFVVSLKNGGGIRTQIGTLSAPKADGTVDKLPPDGGVSQLDVENSLRFNNQLIMFDTTAAGLKAILEHGVAAGTLQGRFPQLGGVSFSWDPDLPAGSRVSDISLMGDGYTVNLYNDGILQAGVPATISVVTLSFLANGGDGYPIKANGENFRYLVQNSDGSYSLTSAVDESLNLTVAASVPGGLTPLGEQTAFAAYMKAFHATQATAYNEVDTPVSADTRIQNLNYRSEAVLDTAVPYLLNSSVDGLGNTIKLYFSEPLDTVNLPAAAQFTVSNNGTQSVTQVQVVSNQVILTLAAPLSSAHPVSVSYADKQLKADDAVTLQGASGKDVLSFGGVTVQNWLQQEESLSEGFMPTHTLSLAGAEISAYDAASQRLFVTSFAGLQVVQLDAELKMTLIGTISLGSNDINSVAVKNGLVAVAVAAADKTQPGAVYFLDADARVGDPAMVLGQVTVGALPDMLTFTADGKKVLVANEAEQDMAGNNPEGSVSIIDLSAGVGAATVTTAGFGAFNSQLAALKAEGVRLFAGAAGFESLTVAQDLEPEYISIAPDGKTAFVTLQENNAIAILDLATGQFTDIVPLGLKSFLGLPFDGSDRDGAGNSKLINLNTDQPVFGQYMPDAIASFQGADGSVFYVIANEGDDRNDFLSTAETASVSSLNLDATAFPNAAALKTNAEIGRLTVSTAPGNNGDLDGDGDIDRLLSYGARSFSILNAAGLVVFDSAAHTEQFIASSGLYSTPTGNGLYDDSRSDNKGTEPEGVTLGVVGGKVLAFVGLERGAGGVMVYDVTNPAKVSFVQYLRQPGDVSPEGLTFVAAVDSPIGKELLFVSNEVSNTVTVYRNLDGLISTYTPNTGTTVGASDASTAVAIDDDWMIVADDEANVLRVYPRDGGAAVLEWSYATNGPLLSKELDLEASVLIGNTLYLIGSHSNKKDGSDAAVDRSHLFAVTITGTGAATQFNYVGKFSELESELIAWDSSNAHGLGVNYFGFAASAAAGVTPERVNGFSIEGLVTSPDNSALWLAFRAPQTSTSSRDHALIVSVTNYTALVAGKASDASFGAPIELDLGGRGIRSISRADDGNYLILAGPSGSASAAVDRDFVLFSWDGIQGHAPLELANALDPLVSGTHGSFESIVDTPDTLATGGFVQLLMDNGDTVWSGKTDISKDLPAAEQQFQGVYLKLQGAFVDTAGPVLKAIAPTDDTVGVAIDSQLVLTFNEGIERAAGQITLHKADGSVIERFDVATSGRLSLKYNTLVIDPTADLEHNNGYYLMIDAGAITDHKGNAYAGLSDSNAYNFTTAGTPTTLQAGDILFVAGNAEAPDAIAFVVLKEIAGGTRIAFSDRDYKDSTGFAGITNETAFVWKADKNYAAGTVVTIQTDTDGNPIADKGHTLGAGGGLGKSETYYAFQGATIDALAEGSAGEITAATRFLASLTLGGAAGAIPAELSTAGAALSFTISPAMQTNARYVGSLDATDVSALAARIKDPNNWQANFTQQPGFSLVDGSFFGAPLLTAASVNGSSATLTFNTEVDALNLPTSSQFALTANATPVAVSAVAATGKTLTLTLARPVVGGEAVALSYSDATSGNDLKAIQLPSGADTPSFSGQVVRNLSPDTAAPTLLSAQPLDEASGVATAADLVLSFSEPIAKGSGSITLKGLDGAADVVINVSSSEVAISGSTLTVNPAGTLAAGKQYAVHIAAGAITDVAGNAYAGITDNTTLNFTTAGRQNYTLLITEVNSNGSGGDFFELYNYGTTAMDLSGWRWTDEAALFASASGVFASGTTLAAGARMLVVQATDATAFKTAWGLSDSVPVLAVGGPGLGKQDAVVLFDQNGFVATAFNYDTDSVTASDGTLISTALTSAGQTFWDGQHAGSAYHNGATAVDKRSAVWDGVSFSRPAYEVASVGIDGALGQSADTATIGSPGQTPALDVGDLVFLGANGDATDAFAFAILQGVAAGQKIGFTDRDYTTAAGMPATGESAYVWTADRAYDAGTVITIQPDQSGNPLTDKGLVQGKGGGISSSAETVYAFLGQVAGLADGAAGAITVDKLLASINVGGGAAGDVPTSIAATSMSFAQDNAKFIGTLDFTDINTFVTALSNPANWSTSDSAAFPLTNNSLFPAG